MFEPNSLPACGKTTKNVFIVKSLLLLLFVFNSCNKTKENGGREEVVSDSIKQIETAKQGDSFLKEVQRTQKVYVGDFDTMLKRRIVRVLVPYSRTLFFNDKGKEHGITADNFREFEVFLNRRYNKERRGIPFTVVFLPTPRDQLIPNVIKGLGDIAAGNLTATEERMRKVDFVAPKEQGIVSEVVLTNMKDSPITNLEQLSGRTIYVRKASSYFESLQKINKMLTSKGKIPATLEVVSEDASDEDLMEMLNAGIISTIVVDDWVAKMWVQVLPDIRINERVVVGKGYIGCAYRKNSPLLTAELNDFYHNFSRPLGSMPYRLKKYYRNVKELQDPTNSGNAKRYKEIIQLFRKYGRQYDFDPLMLAAMGFQESQLNQNERSAVGAIGVMQIMPKTGAEMKVGDIRVVEHNIHAATKYMNVLMTEYFEDAHFDKFNKSMFAFASYNAGPNRVVSLRKIAAERGLNPDVWLNSVEIIASEEVGLETTTYVRNVLKYYLSYKLMVERSEEERKQGKAF